MARRNTWQACGKSVEHLTCFVCGALILQGNEWWWTLERSQEGKVDLDNTKHERANVDGRMVGRIVPIFDEVKVLVPRSWMFSNKTSQLNLKTAISDFSLVV